MRTTIILFIILFYPLLSLSQNASLDNVESHYAPAKGDSLTTVLLGSRKKYTAWKKVIVKQNMAAAEKFAKQKLPFNVYSPEQVALYLTAPFESDKLKAWAIFIWISTNIQYDKDYYSLTKRDLVRIHPLEVILYKKTTCIGYANLFYMMAKAAKIKSVVVTGFFKSTLKGSTPYSTKHAWNIVKLDDIWYNLDIACYDPLYPDYAFMTEADTFQLSHFSEIRAMQLTTNPIAFNAFKLPAK